MRFNDNKPVVTNTCDGVKNITDLYSNHDEADSRLLLHVSGIVTSFGTTTDILWSPDTGELVLGVALKNGIDI